MDKQPNVWLGHRTISNIDKTNNNLCMYLLITRYGSTLYIGIAMVFVFSPYIRKFSSYFHFQVILSLNDFIALSV